MPLAVRSFKFHSSHRSGLKILCKIVANFLGGNASLPTITKGRGFSMPGGGLELGKLSILSKSDLLNIYIVKSPPSLRKLIIATDQSKENYGKYLFVIKGKEENVMRCLYFIVFAINNVHILHIFNTSTAFWDMFTLLL